MAVPQEIIDTLNSSQPLSQLEQARPTANGQNFRAPGFIGNYDRQVIAGQPDPVGAPAPQVPTTGLQVPQTPLGRIGIDTGNGFGNGGGGGGGNPAGGEAGNSPSPATGLADRSDLAPTLGNVANGLLGVASAVPSPVQGIALGVKGAIALGKQIASLFGNNDTPPDAPTKTGSSIDGTKSQTAVDEAHADQAAPTGGVDSNGNPAGGAAAAAGGVNGGGANGMGVGGGGASAAGPAGSDGPNGGQGGNGDTSTGGFAMGGQVRPTVGPARQPSQRFQQRRGGLPMAEGGAVARTPMQDGGQVSGPGTENSDSVPIEASKDEFVVPAEVAKFYGRDFFEDLIKTADQKMGKPRGADANGKPPSPAAQASFRQTQGGEESPAHEAQESPDEEAAEHDMTQQPEASNPRHAPQGTPLRAAGPTMAPSMAMGGTVDLNGMPDGDLMQHARMSKAKGDRAGHEAASREIRRRLAAPADPAMAKGGQVKGYAMGGEIPAPDTGAAQSTVGKRPTAGFYGGGNRVGPTRIPSANFAARVGGGANVRVPPVHASGGGVSPAPAMPIGVSGPRPQGTPTPPAVIGQGPAQSVAPPPAVPRSASPSASGMPRTPRTALGAIGRR